MRIVGIDISFDRIKFVETIDGNIISTGIGEETILSKIREKKPDLIITGIRGSQILTRTYRFTRPQLFQKWLEQSVDTIIPGVSRKDVILAHHFVTDEDVLIGIVRRDLFDEIIKVLRKYDLIPDIVEGTGLPLYYLFQDSTAPNSVIAFCEKRAITTIVIRNGLPYTSHYRTLGRRYLEESVNELRTILNFHQKNFPITDIAITGPSTRKIISRLEQEEIKARALDPGIDADLTIAYGLTLRKKDLGLDLFPGSLRVAFRKMRTRKILTRISDLCLAISVPIVAVSLLTFIGLEKRIERLLAEQKDYAFRITGNLKQIPELEYYGRHNRSSDLSWIGRSFTNGISITMIRNEEVKGKTVSEQIRIKGNSNNEKLVVEFVLRLKRIGNFLIKNIRMNQKEGVYQFEIIVAR